MVIALLSLTISVFRSDYVACRPNFWCLFQSALGSALTEATERSYRQWCTPSMFIFFGIRIYNAQVSTTRVRGSTRFQKPTVNLTPLPDCLA